MGPDDRLIEAQTTAEPARKRRQLARNERKARKARRKQSPSQSESVTGESVSSIRTSEFSGQVETGSTAGEPIPLMEKTDTVLDSDSRGLVEPMTSRLPEDCATPRPMMTPEIASEGALQRAVDALQRLSGEYAARLHISIPLVLPNWGELETAGIPAANVILVAEEVRLKLLSGPVSPSCPLVQLVAMTTMPEGPKKDFARERFNQSLTDWAVCLAGSNFYTLVETLEKPRIGVPPVKEIQEKVNEVYSAFTQAAANRMRFESDDQFQKSYLRRIHKVTLLMGPYTV